MVSQSTIETIRLWIVECDNHSNCTQQPDERDSTGIYRGPSRLVFLSTDDPDFVKIVDVEINVDYLALSYCWGGDGTMKLTKSSLDKWNLSLPVQELPRTLRDSVAFARYLGSEYIWIDRLYIIQDDQQDITREIAAMPEINSQAFLTLSVSSASVRLRSTLFVSAGSSAVSQTRE
jgi:hypothetical protein